METLKQRLKELALSILILVVFMPDNFRVDEEKMKKGLEAVAIDIIKKYKGE